MSAIPVFKGILEKLDIRKRVSRIITVSIPLLLVFGSPVVFVVIINSMIIEDLKSQLVDDWGRLEDTLKTKQFPKKCGQARVFPYFYSLDDTIQMADDDPIENWKKLHELHRNDFIPDSNDTGTAKSLFERNMHEKPCGLAITPYDADSILLLQRNEETGLRSTGRDFKLVFARSDSGDNSRDILYVLGRVTDVEDSVLTERFRLYLYYDDLQDERFTIDQKESGELDIASTPMVYRRNENGELDIASTSMVHRRNENGELDIDGRTIKGKWWESEAPKELDEKQKHRYFQLSVENIDGIAAIILVAESLNQEEIIVSRIGTGDPIPLYEEIMAYKITARLSYLLTSNYEVYLTDPSHPLLEPRRNGKTNATGERFAESMWKPYQTWVLNPYLSVIRTIGTISSCNDQETGRVPCLRKDENSSYLLKLQGQMSDHKDVVIVVEGTVSGPQWQVLLVLVFLYAVCVLLAYVFRTLDKNKKELEAANEKLNINKRELEAANEKLNINKRELEAARHLFVHDGEKHLRALEDKVEDLIKNSEKTSKITMEEIKKDFDWVRVLASMDLLNLENTVCKEIEEHKSWGERFNVHASISELANEFKFEDKKIRFKSILSIEQEKDISLNTTRNGDEYFKQALQNLLENAVNYREPESYITVSLDVENMREVVIDVTNFGEEITLRELKDGIDSGKRDIFRLGEQFHNEKGTRHHGIGLYIVSKIIMGYKGSYKNEILLEGEHPSITFTVRLPVI